MPLQGAKKLKGGGFFYINKKKKVKWPCQRRALHTSLAFHFREDLVMSWSDPHSQTREVPKDALQRLLEDDSCGYIGKTSEGDGQTSGFASLKTALNGPGAQYEHEKVPNVMTWENTATHPERKASQESIRWCRMSRLVNLGDSASCWEQTETTDWFIWGAEWKLEKT